MRALLSPLALRAGCVDKAVLLLWLVACDPHPTLEPPAAGAIKLFPEGAVDCGRSRENALPHALDLERMADAHWERVPFSRADAPRAVMEMGEAESCFNLVGERTGRLRAQAKRRVFVQEVERRFARARLNLDVAVRLNQPERAQHEANEIVALLKHSEDASYRESIRRLSQQYAASDVDPKHKGRP